MGPVLVDVHSRGRLTLASRDPLAAPVIDPGYLTDDRDVQSLVAGVRQAREIASSPPLSELRGAEVLPGEGTAVTRRCASMWRASARPCTTRSARRPWATGTTPW